MNAQFSTPRPVTRHLVDLARLLAISAVLAACGTLYGCSGQIPADQSLGISLNSPVYGSFNLGYNTGTAAAPYTSSHLNTSQLNFTIPANAKVLSVTPSNTVPPPSATTLPAPVLTVTPPAPAAPATTLP